MKSRGVVGKRIVGIEQNVYALPWGGHIQEVTAIVLEDGTELRPLAVETEFEPVVEVIVWKSK